MRPRALLLAVLLQRPAADAAAWFALVVGGYVSACVLPLPSPEERAAAEDDLTQALVHLGQQRLLERASASLAAEAAAGAAAGCGGAWGSPVAGPRVGDGRRQQTQPQEQRAAALRYFASPATLEAAAAGQLLLQGLAAGAVQLAALLGPAPSPAEAEVLCLAALAPAWEAVLRRASGGGGSRGGWGRRGAERAQPAPLPPGERAARASVVAQLCDWCGSSPALLLGLPPALVAEVCRESLRFRSAFTALLRREVQAGGQAALVARAHVRQLQLDEDFEGDGEAGALVLHADSGAC